MSDDLSGKVGLDTTEFKAGVSQLNTSIKSIEASFRASAAVMDDWSGTSNGLKDRVSSLSDILEKQKEKLNILHEEYDKAVASQGEGSKAAESLAGKMFSAEKAISKTQDSIDKYSSQLEKSESPTAGLSDKLGTLGQKVDLSVSKFKVAASGMDDWENKSEGLKAKLQSLSEIAAAQGQKVDTLENVYKKVASAQGEDSQAAQDLAIKLNEEKSALNNTNTDFSKYNEKLKSVEQQEKESTSFLGRFKSAFSGLSDQSQKSTSSISNHLSNLKSTILGFAATAVAGLSLKSIIDSTDAAEKTMAQMGAVLKSTGGAAGMTQKQLTDLAGAQAKVTTFSKGTTEQAENMLLTFTNIKSSVFPQTIQATEDMATAMKMNATDAAKTLGKALNDPAAGLSKLTKQGVTFTDAQKKQITAMQKAGNVAGAQKIILQELNKEFGNSAKAAGSTFTGGIQIMTNNLKSAGISIATSLLPIVTNLMPSIVKIANELASTITAHKGEIIGAVTAAAGVVKSIFTFVESHGPLVKGVVIGIASGFVLWKTTTGIIGGIASAMKNWKTVTDTVSAATKALGIAQTTQTTVTEGDTAAQEALNVAESANPIGAVVAGVVIAVAAIAALTAGIIVLVKHFQSSSIETKKFGDNVSTGTQKAVASFDNLNKKADEDLKELDWSGEAVTKTMANNITANIDTMAKQTVAGFNTQRDQSIQAIQQLANSGNAITKKQMNDDISNINKGYNKRITEEQADQKKINDIVQNAADKHRALTSRETQEVSKLKDDMYKNGIQSLSKNQVEEKAIYENMRVNNTAVSAQEAAAIVRDSKSTTNKVIGDANKKYNDTVAAIIRERDETHSISADQADKLIKAAKKQRDDSIKVAQDQHQKVVSEAKKQSGDLVNQVDWTNGRVKTKWQVFQGNWNKFWSGFAKGASNDWKSFSKGWDNMWNGILNFFKGLPGKFKSAANGIGSAIKNGFNSAISFIKSLPSKMLGWGKDMIQGLINGIKSMIGSVGSAVSGIGNKIRSFLHFSAPDEGPLRDYEQWMPDFMGGMAKGITNNTGKLKSAAMNAASALSSGLKANVNIGGASGMSNTSYSTITNNSSNPIFNITINAAGADVSKQQDTAAMARVLCNQISNQMALATMRRRAAW